DGLKLWFLDGLAPQNPNDDPFHRPAAALHHQIGFPAGLEHAMNLADGLLVIVHMVDDAATQHEIEFFAVERNLLERPDPKLPTTVEGRFPPQHFPPPPDAPLANVPPTH